MTAHGDQRTRQRVTTVIPAASAIGVTSSKNPDLVFCNRHYVAVVPSALLGAGMGGTFSLLAQPMTGDGNAGFTTIGLGPLNPNTGIAVVKVDGFFDAFALDITSTITGGTLKVVINSTVENGM
jgi:hypothetical protein